MLIYLHGGSWQSGRSADFALYAEPYINAGAHFVSVDFTNVRATKGLVDQCRRAIACHCGKSLALPRGLEPLFSP